MSTYTTQQVRPPKSLLRPVGRAMGDYAMIREGDRILLGLSGGKDSLSMLHVLRHMQKHAPIRFAVGAITVDPQVEGFDPSPLLAYLHELGVPHHYVRQPIMERAKTHMQGSSYLQLVCAHEAWRDVCHRASRGATMYWRSGNISMIWPKVF